MFRASTKGRNFASIPIRRSFWSFYIRVRIAQMPVRSYKLAKERFFWCPNSYTSVGICEAFVKEFFREKLWPDLNNYVGAEGGGSRRVTPPLVPRRLHSDTLTVTRQLISGVNVWGLPIIRLQSPHVFFGYRHPSRTWKKETIFILGTKNLNGVNFGQ